MEKTKYYKNDIVNAKKNKVIFKELTNPNLIEIHPKLKTAISKEEEGWIITEIKTGSALSNPNKYYSKEKAIETAKENVEVNLPAIPSTSGMGQGQT